MLMIGVVLGNGVSPLCSITTRFWYQKLGKAYRALLIKNQNGVTQQESVLSASVNLRLRMTGLELKIGNRRGG